MSSIYSPNLKIFFDPRKAPEVRGMLFTRGWGKVQLGPDTWDWDAFDKQVEHLIFVKVVTFSVERCGRA